MEAGLRGRVSAAAHDAMRAAPVAPRALIDAHRAARQADGGAAYASVQRAPDGTPFLVFADGDGEGQADELCVGLLPEGIDWPRRALAHALQSRPYFPCEIRDAETERALEERRPDLSPPLAAHVASGLVETAHPLPGGATLRLRGVAPAVIVARVDGR